MNAQYCFYPKTFDAAPWQSKSSGSQYPLSSISSPIDTPQRQALPLSNGISSMSEDSLSSPPSVSTQGSAHKPATPAHINGYTSSSSGVGDRVRATTPHHAPLPPHFSKEKWACQQRAPPHEWPHPLPRPPPPGQQLHGLGQ